MVDKINIERNEHILTIEDPIEFVHQHKQCIVNQREVYSDTASFGSALKVALRQDPRRRPPWAKCETGKPSASASRSAETGPLDLRDPAHQLRAPRPSTASSTCSNRANATPCARNSPSSSKASSASSSFRRSAADACARRKFLVVTPAIRSLIRDDKLHQIQGIMEVSQKYGMQTLNMDLAKLVLQRKITREDAMIYSGDNEQLEKFISGNFRL